jgi:MFS family permease
MFVYVVTVVAALSGLLFGYDTGVISGAILFVRQRFHLGSVGTEVVTSAVVFGAIIGAALADWVGGSPTTGGSATDRANLHLPEAQ